MALAATNVWEIRSDGNADNGGGYNPDRSATSTDYTQQASAQLSLSDLACLNTTTLTSVTGGFTAAMVGNLIRIASGTNFTAGWYEITVRTDTNTVTLDRNPTNGSNASSGVGNVGGALAALATVVSPLVGGNTVWIKKTSGYTTAATISMTDSGTDAAPIQVSGYDQTRGDGVQAVITSTNAAATSVLSITGDHYIVRNLKLDAASLSTRCLYFNSVAASGQVDNCWFLGATQYGFLAQASSNGGMVTRCLATGNGSSGAHAGFGVEGYETIFDRCVARDNAGNGFSAVNTWLDCVNCLAHDNTLSGYYIDGDNTGVRLLYCTAEGNTLDGLRVADAASMSGALLRQNIFAANAGYGARSLTTDYATDTRFRVTVEANAYYGNTLGARSQMPTGSDDITLTASPFTDAANDDFSLNFTLGGGLSARGLALGFGLRGTSAEPSDGLVDAGAVQSGGGAGSGTALGGMRSLWRELTGEKYTDVVPDSVVDRYINRGLEEYSRVTGYHYTDDETSITLVAGTQEYELPVGCNELTLVYWNGQPLAKSDVEQWQRQYVAWRQETGAPREWAMYGGKLVFYPIPDAATVAAEPNPFIRFLSAPREIGTYGPEQLRSQDYAVVVYHAVALWSASYPDSALAQMRLKFYEELFQAETAKAREFYASRLTTR